MENRITYQVEKDENSLSHVTGATWRDEEGVQREIRIEAGKVLSEETAEPAGEGLLGDFFRAKYNYTCQMCGKPQKEASQKIHDHHILPKDKKLGLYVDRKNDMNNGIIGCRTCHLLIVHGRPQNLHRRDRKAVDEVKIDGKGIIIIDKELTIRLCVATHPLYNLEKTNENYKIHLMSAVGNYLRERNEIARKMELALPEFLKTPEAASICHNLGDQNFDWIEKASFTDF